MSLALVVALAALLLLAVACKSDSNDGKTPTSNETPEATDTPDNGGDGGGGGDGGLQGLADLASQAAEGVTANVTYQYTSETNGQTIEAEWVMVQRPPDSRFEIVSTEGGEESRTIVIGTADKSYICTSAGGSESCFESDQAESYTTGFAPLFEIPQTIAGDIGGLGAVDKSEREIAGVHANCFSADAVALGGASEFCFSDEGILLLLRSEAGGTSFTFEAKSASTDVTDADFEPPYEIIEIPTG
jgi:hypothetical protein